MAEKTVKAESVEQVQEAPAVVEVTRQEQANQITKTHMFMAAGFGVVPVPIVDMVGFLAVQYAMTKKLATVYDVEFSKEKVRTIVLSLLGSIAPVALTGTAASFIKFIPVIGTFAGAVSVSTLGAASTYAIGRVFTQHFETGGTLLNFDASKMRSYFKKEFETGEKVATEAQ